MSKHLADINISARRFLCGRDFKRRDVIHVLDENNMENSSSQLSLIFEVVVSVRVGNRQVRLGSNSAIIPNASDSPSISIDPDMLPLKDATEVGAGVSSVENCKRPSKLRRRVDRSRSGSPPRSRHQGETTFFHPD